nr:retrovirus-related Pol polyprotein from transposon TNT 1-94 [Tanacetum cinerariifolium]
MRLFGCLVTILNILDHLGKFDGKDDEGFFVEYSLKSKAFRVLNSRTRIVEENLHIRLSKNTPNIVGSGPIWLFDIDALTKLMNYKLVVAGNQSNGNTESKSSQDEECHPFSAHGKKDEDDGAEADVNNLGTLIQVSHVPITRIHKDHPLDQVIRDVQFAIQTRNMSKNLEEHRKIEEEIYVCQPPGFEDPDFPSKVYKVEKARTTSSSNSTCKKQTVVANSITEAEYVAASSCYGQLKVNVARHNLQLLGSS